MIDSLEDNVLFQHVFMSSVEGILVVDDMGLIIKANPASELMFGYSKEELLQKEVECLIPNEFKKNHKSHRAKYSKIPKPRRMGQNLDLWGLKKDGTLFPLEISLSPTKIEDKHVVIAFVIDITERMSAKQALIISENRMAEAQRLAHVGNWYWNLQTNERNWSDECYRIYGLQPGDKRLDAEFAIDLIHPEDRENATNTIRLAIENQTPYQYEKRIIRPDGTIRYLLANGKVTYSKDNKPLHVFGTIQDITEQKESDLKLKVEENFNKAILEAMPDMLFIQDFKGNYLDCFAPASEKVFLPTEKFIGKNMKEVLPSHVYDIIRHAQDNAFKSNELQIVEYSVANHHTDQFFEARIVNLDQLGFLTIVRDVTIQKMSEYQLKESEIKNRAMLQAIPDIITILNRQGTYLDVHAPDPSILPSPIAEIKGKTIFDFHPQERCEKILKAFSNSEKTKEAQILEYNFKINGELRGYEARIVSKENGNFLIITRDVTARKAIENVLQIRNRALECASSGIIITDAQQPDVPIIYANQAFINSTGYERDDFIGKNSRFLQGEDRDQEEVNIMSSGIEEGKASHVVLRNYRKDGSQFWNEISLTPIYDSDNTLTHFISVQNDVTERKKEEFFKNAINNVMDMIIQHEPMEKIGNTIIETIETAIPNCRSSILILNKERNTLHKLSAPNIPIAFTNKIEGISVGNYQGSCGTAVHLKKEVIVTDIAKSPFWTGYKEIALANNLKACWSFPIFSSDQEVLGTFAIYSETIREPLATEKEIIYDITRAASVAIEQHNISNALKENVEKLAVYTQELENKVAERTNELNAMVQKLTESNLSLEDQIQETREAERKVLRSKTLLDSISQNFPRGFVAVVDSSLSIVFLAGEELDELGFSGLADNRTTIDEVKGIPKDIKTKVKTNIEKTFQGEHLSFEITFQNRFYMVNTTPLLNQDNTIEQVLLVHNNITLQKETEIEIMKTLKKEQELSELKSRFISMASHEFRTPLSAILSSAILIEKQNEVGKEEKRLQHVTKIRSNIKNLVVILNDFLSLSKLEEGKVAVHSERFDFIDFSKSLIEEIKGNKKKGQSIIFDYQSPQIEVYLDPKLLRHIVSNLLSNAIKYSDKNKSITFKVKSNDQHLFLEVIDEGVGIPDENQAKLFERFYRANNVNFIQGTGLGLNIIKQYTELMGGSVSFKSKLNIGSTFYVELPLKTNNYEKNIIN